MHVNSFILAALLGAGAASLEAAPVQWAQSSGGNGHWYEFVETPLGWSAALSEAASRSHGGQAGYLAAVTSAAETAFILASVTSSLAWLGGSDAQTEGRWIWVSGPEAGQVFFGPGAPAGSFASWEAGEPNDCCSGEDFLQINWSSQGGWNDHGGPGNAGQANGYIVEYGPGEQLLISEPGALALALMGLVALGLSRGRWW